MCGINAVINGSAEDLQLMIASSSKRGVNQKIVEFENAFVCFDWLPITDTNAPYQPYKHGDYTLWFNGFISNYKELAEKYQIHLDSKCDTELLVKFLAKFNYKKINELNGFFAILVFHKIHGWYYFTDRYGIKKLYEYQHNGKTFISSELKTILNANPQIKIDINALNDFKHSLGVMRLNTIYKNVFRAKSIPFKIPKKQNISYNDAKAKLSELLKKSFERNKKHNDDCVFLSGGIDSGIIAKHMNPKYCFSMDYVDPNFSEIENIKINSTGIHYSMICNQELKNHYMNKLMDVVSDFKVGSSYTNLALTELASKFCKVIYSGAGGDEFFGGYPHRNYKAINQVIKRTKYDSKQYNIKHFDYDMLFLRGVLNIEDQISGACTMEARYPLLDNDVVDFALSLPFEYLENKRILKDVSGLETEIINSKKKGFSNPYLSNDQWVDYIVEHLKKTQNERF
jgi:asparagine synthase (glutamine-hydrolysing)